MQDLRHSTLQRVTARYNDLTTQHPHTKTQHTILRLNKEVPPWTWMVSCTVSCFCLCAMPVHVLVLVCMFELLIRHRAVRAPGTLRRPLPGRRRRVRGGYRDGAATARFLRALVAGGRFARGAEGRVPLDISREGLSTGGLNFEKGANGKNI